jgi:magnesium transporter
MIDSVTKGYLSLHPASAARTLSRLDTHDIRETLETLPINLAANVLSNMSPQTASQCLGEMDITTSSELVTRMNAARAVAVLRLMGRTQVRDILSKLSYQAAAHLRMRLRFSDSVIGTFADSDVVTLNPEHHVSDALRLFKQNKSHRTSHTIYVVDGDNRLVGTVDLSELLTARDSNTIKGLIHPAPVILNARTALNTVTSHPAWLTHDNLPVTHRDGLFQGVLWRSSVSEHKQQIINSVVDHNETTTTLTALADIFWIAVGAVFSSSPGSTQDKSEHLK